MTEVSLGSIEDLRVQTQEPVLPGVRVGAQGQWGVCLISPHLAARDPEHFFLQ